MTFEICYDFTVIRKASVNEQKEVSIRFGRTQGVCTHRTSDIQISHLILVH